jgi:hypothetical protein
MRKTMMIAGLVAALAAPSLAQARTYCDQRAHDRKVNGAVIGGLGGAVVGNQLARTKCDSYASSHRRTRSASNARPTPASYDRCRYETRSFYDERGRLVQQPTRVCDR